ncbi:hypothetical protein IPC1486_13080 [Pseudomonas aeruginosa]|nr:hypothetical protein IPC1486_13080 [Pseudomonas aeruginosa]TEF32863.1 hypothetical protein IPC1485_11540 [Pseudomonas aeruginosa]
MDEKSGSPIFDSTNLTPDQEPIFREFKSRWSQKKYRENLKGKAQYNFVLSDKAIANVIAAERGCP